MDLSLRIWDPCGCNCCGCGGANTPGGVQDIVLREDGSSLLREDGGKIVRET